MLLVKELLNPMGEGEVGIAIAYTLAQRSYLLNVLKSCWRLLKEQKATQYFFFLQTHKLSFCRQLGRGENNTATNIGRIIDGIRYENVLPQFGQCVSTVNTGSICESLFLRSPGITIETIFSSPSLPNNNFATANFRSNHRQYEVIVHLGFHCQK